MKDLAPNEYRCAMCHEVFTMGWSDEEAKAELAEKFPGIPPEDCALVCETCFKELGLL